MYANNNNNNNNNNNHHHHHKKGGGEVVRREHWREGGDFLFFIFSLLASVFRSTKIGSKVFIGTEGKVDLRDESYV